MTSIWRNALSAFVLALAASLLPAAAQTAPAPTAPPVAVQPQAQPAPAPAAPAIKLGSIVQLQSGGPQMTVVALATTAVAQWYVNAATGFRKEEFPVAALKLVDADEDEDDEDDEDENEDEDEDDEDE